MLLPTHAFIWWSFVTGATLFLGTWAAVVVSRHHADRIRAWSDRIRELAVDAAADRRALHHAALAAAVRRAPLAASSHVLLDAAPKSVHAVLAQTLVECIGLDRLRHRGLTTRLGRWRRIAALRILALGSPSDAWDLFDQAASGDDGVVAGAAIGLLGQIRDLRAADILVDTLREGRCARSRVATALDAFPLDISDRIAPLLDADDPAIRYWATVLMGRYPYHPSIAVRLTALASDPDPLVRKAAADLCAAVDGAEALATARTRLTDSSSFVRGHAARALATHGGRGVAAAIAPLLADRDWSVRLAAKQSLALLGADASATLERFLSHPDGFARNGAAEVLQNLGAFEQLLMLEIAGVPDPRRRETLRLLAAAGGVQMSDMAISRLRPEAQMRGRQLLTELELVEVS